MAITCIRVGPFCLTDEAVFISMATRSRGSFQDQSVWLTRTPSQ